MLMGIELPALSAVVARLADPQIHLAAYGGIVFPLALIIESPIIMLLAASTALSKDWASYLKLRRFMIASGAALTLLHILIAFTPLYYFVVEGILGAPEEIVAPARVGLMIMTPWTWSIAYRRFNQGVLIRFGHSRMVGIGTVVRLVTNGAVLAGGYLAGDIPGIVVGASAVATGVVAEALYVGWVVQPVLNHQLKPAVPVPVQITLRSFLSFYIPLALTSLLLLITQPMGSAAISRMPQALASLAVWPVITGLIFIFRSMGMAFNEVVVALLDEPHSIQSLRRFSLFLTSAVTLGMLVITATPIAKFWFEQVSALPPELSDIARNALWLGLFLPGLNVIQSWFQGALVNSRHTAAITESVVIFLLIGGGVLLAGVVWGEATGLYFGIGAFSFSMLAQSVWLWHRSKKPLAEISARDSSPAQAQVFKAPAD
jgi:hypothetical protein